MRERVQLIAPVPARNHGHGFQPLSRVNPADSAVHISKVTVTSQPHARLSAANRQSANAVSPDLKFSTAMRASLALGMVNSGARKIRSRYSAMAGRFSLKLRSSLE